MYFELDFRKLALVILVVACTIIGFNYYERQHPKPIRTPAATFYAMGADKTTSNISRWHVILYGADKTDVDELFKRAPLNALTNQVNYDEAALPPNTTEPFLEVYRVNNQNKDWWNDDFLNQNKTVVIRRWLRDMPYGGDALAQFIAEQIELSGLLPPPQN